MRRKGNPFALLVGMQTGTAISEKGLEFPQKLKMDLPYDPAISLLEIYPKEPETLIEKNVCTPMFIAELFTVVKIWKEPISR